MNARARIAAFFGRSATRGPEQSRVLSPAASPRAKGSSAPSSLRTLLALGLAAVFALALPASASAALIHQFSFSFDGASTPAGSLSTPDGVAVDQATGDVFVADIGHNVVDRFDAGGNYVSQLDGSTTPAGAFTFARPAALAVDNSTNPLDPSAGSLYVLDSGAKSVYQFDDTGAYVGQVSGGAFAATLRGIAVDAEGDVWVYDSTGTVRAFDGTGALVWQYSTGIGTGIGFAVDANQYTYPVRSGNNGVLKFNTPAAGFNRLGTLDSPAYALTANLATDRVFVDHGSSVVVWDSTGAFVESFGSGKLTNTANGGIAVNSSTDRAYVANPADNSVYAFDTVLVPDVTTEAVSGLTGSVATLNGTVNPLGQPATYQFEYGETSSYGSASPASPGDAGSGSSPVPVNAELTGLTPNTTYHYRLNGINANGAFHGADATFTTADKPIVDITTYTSEVSETAAVLHGSVNPDRAETTYRFQYGTSTAYGGEAPIGGAQIPAGEEPAAIEAALSGLAPGTLYHYRIVATNVVGTSTGADHTFTTPEPSLPFEAGPFPGRGFLPDNRGWELVSPPDKNGADVMGDSARTRAASEGGAASFSSLGGFADVRGTGVANEYISERSADPAPGNNGWSTHAITPRQEPLSFTAAIQALDPIYEGELSADLKSGVFRAWSPLTADPLVADAQNLYVRHDLRTPGAGSYQLATPCPACSAPLPPIHETLARPWLAGASADFTHLVYESIRPLTPESTGDNASMFNVFESDNGTLRLASLVPPPGETSCGEGGPACVPAASAIAGVGASHNFYTLHVVSDDGSHVFFTDTSASPGSFSGALYARIGGTRTVQLNASERTDCADNDPCTGAPEPDPSGSQPAKYQTASNDGKRVFFITNEQLVDSDKDGGFDLYMYDQEAPAGQHLTRLSVNGAGEHLDALGVIGASADGHWVYFMDFYGAMFLWHDGTVSGIGHLDDQRDRNADLPTEWTLDVLQARVTPSGHQLLFASHSGTGLDGRDHRVACDTAFASGGEPCQALYLYNADDATTTCVSCDPGGGPVTDNAKTNAYALAGGALTTWHLSHPLTDNGKRVFFSTRAALVPGDTNDAADAYEWRAQGVGGCARAEGCIALLSSGTDKADSYFMDASADGSDAFFLTRQQLVGWDTDHAYDLYDARVGGGFPEPPPVTAPCNGDSCRSASPQTPQAAGTGSAAFSGAGNLKPKHCPKGRRAVRRHGKTRCLKPRHHKHRKHHKKASRNRGGQK